MRSNEDVAFLLPTSDGAAIEDTNGRIWRYLRYDPDHPYSRSSRSSRTHDGGLCYWYWDDTETQIRWILASILPCPHQVGSLPDYGTGSGSLIETDDVIWVSSEGREQLELIATPNAVSGIHRLDRERLTVRFTLDPIVSARNQTGHSVELRERDEALEETLRVGHVVSRYWETLAQHRYDEARLQRPANSSTYRDRAERLLERRDELEAAGYNLTLLDEGSRLDRDEEFGPRTDPKRSRYRTTNIARIIRIGEWAQTHAYRERVATEAAAVNGDAVGELLGW